MLFEYSDPYQMSGWLSNTVNWIKDNPLKSVLLAPAALPAASLVGPMVSTVAPVAAPIAAATAATAAVTGQVIPQEKQVYPSPVITAFSAVQPEPQAVTRPPLKTGSLWKNNPVDYSILVKKQFEKRPTDAEQKKFARVIRSRIKGWTPDPRPQLKVIAKKKFQLFRWITANIFPGEYTGLVNQLHIKLQPANYAKTVLTVAEKKSGDQDKLSAYISKIRGYLDKWAGSDFLTKLPDEMREPFAQVFAGPEIQAAAVGTGGGGRIMGLALVGIIGITLISQLGKKKTRNGGRSYAI